MTTSGAGGFFSRFFKKEKKVSDVEPKELPEKKEEVSSSAAEEKEKYLPQDGSSADSSVTAGMEEKVRQSEETLPSEQQRTDSEVLTSERPASEETSSQALQDKKGGALSWFARLKQGMQRSSQALTSGLAALLGGRKLDAQSLEDLEDLLIQADLGIDAAKMLVKQLGQRRYEDLSETEIRSALSKELTKILAPALRALPLDAEALQARVDGEEVTIPPPSLFPTPYVILFVGVNGTGKTSSIGKLAVRLGAQGKKVILAAGDTFRAAAVEQLQIWGERAHAAVVVRPQGSDPGGLVFDALKTAQEEKADVLLIDTAGRLHNRAELMAELEKIVRVIRKYDPTGPHEVLLTLDATTGQNALTQVALFKKTAGVTGLILNKLDGTARGGILVPITQNYALPVYFVGVGEGQADLIPFSAQDFAQALVGLEA